MGISVLVAALIAIDLAVAELAPASAARSVGAGTVLRVSVPGAIGGKMVIGQIAVDNATESGFVTAYGCDDGLPISEADKVSRADLNYDGGVSPVWSNRLIIAADDDGDVCFYMSAEVDMIMYGHRNECGHPEHVALILRGGRLRTSSWRRMTPVRKHKKSSRPRPSASTASRVVTAPSSSTLSCLCVDR